MYCRRIYILFTVLTVFCMTSFYACRLKPISMSEIPGTGLITVTPFPADQIAEIAETTPMFLEIGYQSTERLVIYGAEFLAVYRFDTEKETYALDETVDLSVLDIALMEHDFTATACFRENDVLLSPSRENTSPAQEPVYQYEYGSGVIRRLDELTGETIAGLHWEEAFRPLSYLDASLAEQISEALKTQSSRLLSPIGILNKFSDSAGTALLNQMEFGFLAINPQEALVYGVSDASGTSLLFPIFQP